MSHDTKDSECGPPQIWGVERPTKFSKRKGLTGPQLLEGSRWERGGVFFKGGCNFHKN